MLNKLAESYDDDHKILSKHADQVDIIDFKILMETFFDNEKVFTRYERKISKDVANWKDRGEFILQEVKPNYQLIGIDRVGFGISFRLKANVGGDQDYRAALYGSLLETDGVGYKLFPGKGLFLEDYTKQRIRQNILLLS